MDERGPDAGLRLRWEALRPRLDERQRRLFAAAEAQALGRGGVARVMRATGLARGTIAAGLCELARAPGESLDPGKARRPGAGRKPVRRDETSLIADLRRLVEDARGPRGPSIRALAAALRERGHRIGRGAIGRLLVAEGIDRVAPRPGAIGKAARIRVPRSPAAPSAPGPTARAAAAPPANARASERRPDEPVGPARRDIVASLAHGLAVIGAFDHHRARLTIAEVALHCGFTRAAARRYLMTLEHFGYAERHHGMYALTPKVIRLGQSFMYSSRLPQIIQPELMVLASTMQEASSAGVLDGDDVISIAATTAARNVSSTLFSGTRVPAYCTSNGRALLSGFAPDVVEAWVARQQLRPLTRHTITNARRLCDAIVEARARGYAQVDQEFEIGLRTVAVPLINHRGDVVASLNVGASAARTTMRDLVDRFLPALQAAQARLRPLL